MHQQYLLLDPEATEWRRELDQDWPSDNQRRKKIKGYHLLIRWSSFCWCILIAYTPHVQTHFFKTKHNWTKKVFKTIQPCYFHSPSSRVEIRQLFLRIWCMFLNWIDEHLLSGLRKLEKIRNVFNLIKDIPNTLNITWCTKN